MEKYRISGNILVKNKECILVEVVHLLQLELWIRQS